VTFGSPGTACLDTKTGAKIWERTDFVCNHYRGAGSSAIVWGDLLIMNFDGSDAQFLVALDKKTGKTVWQTPRSIDFQDLGADGKPKNEGDYRTTATTQRQAKSCGALKSAATTAPPRAQSRALAWSSSRSALRRPRWSLLSSAAAVCSLPMRPPGG
jgi:hypothetical protein